MIQSNSDEILFVVDLQNRVLLRYDSEFSKPVTKSLKLEQIAGGIANGWASVIGEKIERELDVSTQNLKVGVVIVGDAGTASERSAAHIITKRLQNTFWTTGINENMTGSTINWQASVLGKANKPTPLIKLLDEMPNRDKLASLFEQVSALTSPAQAGR